MENMFGNLLTRLISQQDLKRIMSTLLSETDQDIIELLYCLKDELKKPLKHMEIAQRLGMRVDTIRLREVKALTAIREWLMQDLLYEKCWGSRAERSDKISPNTPISKLELNTRTYNCMRREGIRVLKDLEEYSKWELLRLRNFGLKCFEEISSILIQADVKLKKIAMPETLISELGLSESFVEFLAESGTTTLKDVEKLYIDILEKEKEFEMNHQSKDYWQLKRCMEDAELTFEC